VPSCASNKIWNETKCWYYNSIFFKQTRFYVIVKKKTFSSLIPLKFTQRLRDGRRWIFEYIIPYAKHIVLDICVPHHLGDVHGKCTSVDKRDVFVELLDVLADKIPLVKCKKFSGSCCHFETSINFQHPVEQHTLY